MPTVSQIPVASPEFAADLLALCKHGVKTARLTRSAAERIRDVLEGRTEDPAPASASADAATNRWVSATEAAGYLGFTTPRQVPQKCQELKVRTMGQGRGRRYHLGDILTANGGPA